MTMTLKMASAPHLRLTERSAALSLDVLIALVPLCVFSFVHYGVRPVLLVLTGIVTAVVCELLCCAFMRRKPSVLDGTAAVTGGLVGAMMSPLSPYWLPVIAAAFAILVVKMPFGGARPECLQSRRRGARGGDGLFSRPGVSLPLRGPAPAPSFGGYQRCPHRPSPRICS